MTVVDPGGIILALDAAGYGIVTITKSVTITASPGFYAGMGNSTGSVITIATPGVIVTLRGLNIDSTGATNGINMSNGVRLSIENCVISNFANIGVNVTTAAQVRIVDTLIRDNEYGVYLSGGATGTISGSKILNSASIGVFIQGTIDSVTTSAAISDSIVTGGNTGLHAGATIANSTAKMSVTRSTLSHSGFAAVLLSTVGTAVITIGDSMVTSNGTGLYNSGIGTTLESLGNNMVRQNGSATNGTITTVLPM